MATRVLVVEDHEMIRQGLCVLLKGLDDVQLVGQAPDGRRAIEMTGELSPDVIIMDVAMPGLNGIEATRQLQAGSVAPKVIALSGTATERSVQAMMEAGASAFVAKSSAFEELAEALKAVKSNQSYISPSLAPLMSSWKVGAGEVQISPRERETLQLIAEGKSTKEIARTLNLSVKTIETHRRNLMEKLNIDSVAGLTKYAIREGVTTVS